MLAGPRDRVGFTARCLPKLEVLLLRIEGKIGVPYIGCQDESRISARRKHPQSMARSLVWSFAGRLRDSP